MEMINLSLKNDANLQVYYRFEDNLNDSSAGGHTGTFEGTGSASYVTARYNKGIDLEENSNQRVTTNYTPAVGTGNFSISCWIKPETIAAGDSWGFASTYDLVVTNSGFAIGRNTLYGGVIFQCVAGGNADTLTGQTALAEGVWKHIVAVRDNSYLRLYVNGVEDAGSPVSSNNRNVNSSQPLRVGSFYTVTVPGNLGVFDGVMDEFSFFNKALNASEAKQLYQDVGGLFLLNII